MSTTSETKVLQLAPYIFFYGRCEEALAFYKGALGGTYELMRTKESPMADQFPAEMQEKVMHASFTAPGLTFMASDGREIKAIDSEAGNISLALSATDRAAGEKAFNALSAGGKVKMPLKDAFWGGQFGMFDDRFGIEWMVTTP
ncbi:MAG TPA: VOC family protein [Candidatus Limnocylindria bacterium]|jgi:PhnB protein|nr:VOC family protein [Candidatus Limnocylindria bacterium]